MQAKPFIKTIVRLLALTIALSLSACQTLSGDQSSAVSALQNDKSSAQNEKLSTQAKQAIPASISELTITSSGSRMPGIAYLAEGEGPHPSVLLLHGYPGNEKNLDVAQALRRQGWNVIFFHYRGAWGSEGEFSFRGAERDVQVVLNYMQDPSNAKRLRIDTKRISIVGHSMGGHMAIAGILDNADVKCAVAYDGANMGARGNGLFSDPESTKLWSAYSDSLFMLNGWSGVKAVQEINEFGKEIDLIARVGSIAKRATFLIAADTDVIPLDTHIKPLFAALKDASQGNAHYLLLDDDHSFSSSRLKLISATENFLSNNCR